jgi:hypothetical protein
MFAKWSAAPGVGYRSAIDWKIQQEEIQSTEAMGKRFLAITQAEPTDSQAVRFGWASALLDGNGATSFMAAGNYDSEAWSSEFEVPVGEPTGAATPIGGGAWAREFSGGLVVVNPGASSVRVALGGTYSGDGLLAATEATVAGDSALILTRGAGTVQAPPAGEALGASGAPSSQGPTAPSGDSTAPQGSHAAGAPTRHTVTHRTNRRLARQRARCRGRAASRAHGASARLQRRAFARCVRAAGASRHTRAYAVS